MEITTPSGYKVVFKDKLNYGDRKAIKGIMLREMKLEMSVDKDSENKAKLQPLSLEFQQQMEEEVFNRAIVSIQKEDKTLTSNLLAEVYTWDDEDGEAVFAFLNDNFDPKGAADTEKKS